MSMTFELKEVDAPYGNAMFGEMSMDWTADNTLMGIDTPDDVAGTRNMTVDMAMVRFKSSRIRLGFFSHLTESVNCS